VCDRAESGELQGDVASPGVKNFQDIDPSLEVPSNTFARALYDIYLADDSPVQDAREQWAQAAMQLLKYD
jgi:hypothetical protein